MGSSVNAKKIYRKEYFISVGQVPKNVALVTKGLFAQYYISTEGDIVIKNFFQEGRIAGSVPSTLTKSESPFAIEALEDTTVIEFDFLEFKKLVRKHNVSSIWKNIGYTETIEIKQSIDKVIELFENPDHLDKLLQ